MPLRPSSLAAAIFLLATAFLAWSSLHLSDDLSFRRPKSASANAHLHAELVKQQQRLEQALELARARPIHATATTVTSSGNSVPTNEPSAVTSLNHEDTPAKPDGFAYVFYATSNTYACSVLVNVHRLQHVLKSTLPIHVLVTSDVDRPLLKAMQDANATIHIRKAPALPEDAGYYQDCLLKLLAFQLHALSPGLKRVLAFDADQLILKNLDHLFHGLPNVDLAAPRAYWMAKDFLASTFMMISLSDRLWKTVKEALDAVSFNKFDMDLVNELLGDEVMMLSGEYVMLNSHFEDWNLPRWYHPVNRLNMTTIELLNELSKSKVADGKRDDNLARTANETWDGPETCFTSSSGNDAASIQSSSTVTPSPPPSKPTLASNGQGSDLTLASLPSHTPRFPASHPLTDELYRLNEAASVIHFTALGKPWTHSAESVAFLRPDAHPVLAEQFELWRQTAADVCPGGIPSA